MLTSSSFVSLAGLRLPERSVRRPPSHVLHAAPTRRQRAVPRPLVEPARPVQAVRLDLSSSLHVVLKRRMLTLPRCARRIWPRDPKTHKFHGVPINVAALGLGGDDDDEESVHATSETATPAQRARKGKGKEGSGKGKRQKRGRAQEEDDEEEDEDGAWLSSRARSRHLLPALEVLSLPFAHTLTRPHGPSLLRAPRVGWRRLAHRVLARCDSQVVSSRRQQEEEGGAAAERRRGRGRGRGRVASSSSASGEALCNAAQLLLSACKSMISPRACLLSVSVRLWLARSCHRVLPLVRRP